MEEERAGAGPGLMVMDRGSIQDPRKGRTFPAQPYEIWEVYGGGAMSRAEKAEVDAICNYGRPIRIRAPGRR